MSDVEIPVTTGLQSNLHIVPASLVESLVVLTSIKVLTIEVGDAGFFLISGSEISGSTFT